MTTAKQKRSNREKQLRFKEKLSKDGLKEIRGLRMPPNPEKIELLKKYVRRQGGRA